MAGNVWQGNRLQVRPVLDHLGSAMGRQEWIGYGHCLLSRRKHCVVFKGRRIWVSLSRDRYVVPIIMALFGVHLL